MIDSLNCCTVTVVPHMVLYFPPRTAVLLCVLTRVMHMDSKVCAFSPTYSLALAANIVRLERVVSENSRRSYSRRVFELGRIVSLLIVRPLEYPSNLN